MDVIRSEAEAPTLAEVAAAIRLAAQVSAVALPVGVPVAPAAENVAVVSWVNAHDAQSHHQVFAALVHDSV